MAAKNEETLSLGICCCNVKTAAIVWAWIDIVLAIIFIVFFGVVLIDSDNYCLEEICTEANGNNTSLNEDSWPALKTWLIVNIFVSAGMVVFAALTLHGIKQIKPHYILPYIVFKLFVPVYLVIYLIYDIRYRHSEVPWAVWGILVWIILVVAYQVAVTFHCYSFIQDIKKENMRETEENQGSPTRRTLPLFQRYTRIPGFQRPGRAAVQPAEPTVLPGVVYPDVQVPMITGVESSWE